MKASKNLEEFNENEENNFLGISLNKKKEKSYEKEKFKNKIKKEFGKYKIKSFSNKINSKLTVIQENIKSKIPNKVITKEKNNKKFKMKNKSSINSSSSNNNISNKEFAFNTNNLNLILNKENNLFSSTINFKDKQINRKFNHQLIQNKKKYFCFIENKKVNKRTSQNNEKLNFEIFSFPPVTNDIIENKKTFTSFNSLKENTLNYEVSIKSFKELFFNTVNKENNLVIKKQSSNYTNKKLNELLYYPKNPNLFIESGNTNSFTDASKLHFWLQLFASDDIGLEIGIYLIKKFNIFLFEKINLSSIENNNEIKKTSNQNIINLPLLKEETKKVELKSFLNVKDLLFNEKYNSAIKFLNFKNAKNKNKISNESSCQSQELNKSQDKSLNDKKTEEETKSLSINEMIGKPRFSIVGQSRKSNILIINNNNKNNDKPRDLSILKIDAHKDEVKTNLLQPEIIHLKKDNLKEINDREKKDSSISLNSSTSTISKLNSNFNSKIELEKILNKHGLSNINAIFNPLYGKFNKPLKELILKNSPLFLNYKCEEKLNIQVKLLSLLPDQVLLNCKILDGLKIDASYKNNEEVDFKNFYNQYGSGSVKKPTFFNKKGILSKNLKQTSVIWPLIKKENVSEILSLESIYDAIFNKS